MRSLAPLQVLSQPVERVVVPARQGALLQDHGLRDGQLRAGRHHDQVLRRPAAQPPHDFLELRLRPGHSNPLPLALRTIHPTPAPMSRVMPTTSAAASSTATSAAPDRPSRNTNYVQPRVHGLTFM